MRDRISIDCVNRASFPDHDQRPRMRWLEGSGAGHAGAEASALAWRRHRLDEMPSSAKAFRNGSEGWPSPSIRTAARMTHPIPFAGRRKSMRLFVDPVATTCRPVLAIVSHLQLELEVDKVSLAAGEHLSPAWPDPVVARAVRERASVNAARAIEQLDQQVLARQAFTAGPGLTYADYFFLPFL